MKAVIQRVKHASVTVDDKIIGEIEQGFLVLLGVAKGDSEDEMLQLAKKISEIRIFTDENDKMNLSINDIGGDILVVSQFTLCADTSHGRRPSFTKSAPAVLACELYEKFNAQIASLITGKVQTGEFGADMQVDLLNDGPVTILMDTDEYKKG